ncbi:hypothetical protein GRI97_04370 [Altererythrobacter xixiisoli]|uniref:Uncharacterized protein n=1 Tax=Croceibacterium xixiisoli TaxID=1476466 RepID=A0A6I4TSR8_9SPHN|nr:hypothetical protein [Croceibacterium xixiisoli]MXO98220.1 hypothetical protein [Croceibacterium xixiisoli]
MNETLLNRIVELRARLAAEPAAPLFGDIPAGSVNPQTGSPLWDDFLRVADGARFGSVDLFSSSEISGKQFYLQGRTDALVIGQILYLPLILDKNTGCLALMRDDTIVDLGPCDPFIETFLLGPRYVEIEESFVDDDWCTIVSR